MIGKTGFNREELKEILEQEFLIPADGWGEEEYRRAEAALFAFDSVEMFLEATGWEKDNPEISREEYLTENRICRWAAGKFYYFSRLLWEGEKRG